MTNRHLIFLILVFIPFSDEYRGELLEAFICLNTSIIYPEIKSKNSKNETWFQFSHSKFKLEVYPERLW